MPQTGAIEEFDVVVVGAGMAGASIASELAPARRVALLERESQPGYHTTGRSAALFSETYGPAQIRALSRASARFFDAPPAGFAEVPLLSPRGVLVIGRRDQRAAIEALWAAVSPHGRVERLGAEACVDRLPLIRRAYVDGAVFEPRARDIDVHALHQGYLRRFRSAGGTIMTHAGVVAIDRERGGWRIATRDRTLRAGVLVDAAGAWADEIGEMAGAAPIGLVPKRRTALIVPAPEGIDPSGFAMAVDVDERFYLKPDAGRLLISPADETPSPPCDAQPEEIDVAICVDRIETAFDLAVRHIDNRWAGLRSFVADKTPVAGFDPDMPGFFWLAGQGGYGIQSAPALARLSAALVLGRAVPADIADEGVDPRALAPGRMGLAA